jgi:hypothetical protein
MKSIMWIFVVTLGLNASAAGVKDTRIGPVVGINREVSGIYNNCLSHLVGDVDKPMYAFSCRIDFPIDPKTEVVMNQNPILKFAEETCQVEANFAKEKMMVFFGNPKAPMTLDEAKLCLEKGTKSVSDKFDLLIFKAENSNNKP